MLLLNEFYKEKKILADITPILYQNFPIGFITSLSASIVVFWDYPGNFYIKNDFTWFSIFIIVYLLRWFLFYWYQRTKLMSRFLNYHYYLFILGSTLSALSWGLLISIFMPNAIPNQMITLLVLSIVIGGSTHILGSSFVASFSYIFIITVFLLTWLILQIMEMHGILYGILLVVMTINSIYMAVGCYKTYNLLLNKTLINYEKNIILQEQKKSEQKLQESEQQYRILVELSPYGILIIANDIIKFANTAILNMLHVKNQAALLGKSYFDILHPAYHSVVRIRHENLTKGKRSNEPLDEKLMRLDGGIINVNIKSVAVPYRKGSAIQLFIEDITKLSSSEKIVSYLTYHDPLTGLINRRKLEEIINYSIPFAIRTNDLFSIIYINLDNFKKINELYGLKTGDSLLQEISKMLSSLIKETDVLARIGGDEFALLIRMYKKKSEIIEYIHKLMQLISKPIEFENNVFNLGASIGASIFPYDGDNSFTLINNANIAMRAVKNQGGNNFKFYTTTLTKILIEKETLENRLKNAIAQDQFLMVYQPKVSLITKKIVGLEALVRWKSSINEIIYPKDFIPLAESIGLIIPLSQLILNKVLDQMNIWKINHIFLYKTSINMTADALKNNDFLDYITNCISQYNIDTQLLEIELTESTLIEDLQKSETILRKLKSLGLTISIDDFGTGYSSFSYLNQFEIDTLKIDKSFIDNIVFNKDAATIVKAIIAMAHQLNIQVVAEGVETKEQFNFLKKHGCNQAQGFYISKPLIAEDLVAFIKTYEEQNK